MLWLVHVRRRVVSAWRSSGRRRLQLNSASDSYPTALIAFGILIIFEIFLAFMFLIFILFFSLDCIRKWRQEKQFENKIIRSCPECRVQSDFICPSRYWCETKEEKEQLITDYKKALRLV